MPRAAALAGALTAAGALIWGAQPDAAPKAPQAMPAEQPAVACPTPNEKLVARYMTNTMIDGKQAARLDTDAAVDAIKKAEDTETILARTNAALHGTFVVRLATQQDHEAPADNYGHSDQPMVTPVTQVTVAAMRSTATGVLQALDGEPVALGTLGGNQQPLAIVLAKGIKTKYDAKPKGGYNHEDRQLNLVVSSKTNANTFRMEHELGHYKHELALEAANACRNDEAILRPINLTTTANNGSKKEVVADCVAIAQGAFPTDMKPNALANAGIIQAININNAVVEARIASLGSEGGIIADTLHNNRIEQTGLLVQAGS